MKSIKVIFVEPGQIANSKRPLSRQTGIRYDMSQFYSMKDVMEQLFGNRTYLRLKETAGLKDWKEATIKLLNAILLASESSIAVADDDWRDEFTNTVRTGINLISSAGEISDLFSSLAATLTRIAFIQIGSMPDHRAQRKTVPLAKDWWTLSHFRSVQYVQSRVQRAALDEVRESRKAARLKRRDDEACSDETSSRL